MNCLHCNSPISHQGPGQPKKFCSDAHKKAYARSLKSNPSLKPADPQTPSTTIPSDNLSHLDQNPFDKYPPEIAPYMPSRQDLNISYLIARKPLDLNCPF